MNSSATPNEGQYSGNTLNVDLGGRKHIYIYILLLLLYMTSVTIGLGIPAVLVNVRCILGCNCPSCGIPGQKPDSEAPGVIVPLIKYGVDGDLLEIYPKQYSIYLRGIIGSGV